MQGPMTKDQSGTEGSYAAAELAAIIESTRDLIWSVDLDYRLITFNRAYADHILKNFGNIASVGMLPQDLVDLPTAANWPPMYSQALSEGSLHTEYALPDERWLELSLNPILKDGEAIGISVFGKDITLRKQAYEALQQSEELLIETGETAKIGGWEFNPETGNLVWTREVFRIHEVAADFLPTLESAIGFYTPESRPVIEQAVGRAISHGDPFDVELAICTAKGNRKDVHSIGRVRIQQNGTRVVSGTFQDITEYKRSRDALRESEARLREAEILGDFGSSSWDFGTDTIRWSEGLYRITGRRAGEAPQDHAERAKLYTPESWSRLQAAVQRTIAMGERYDLELQIVLPDGSLRWTRGRGEAVLDSEGKVKRLFGTLQDIDTKKRLEAEMRESEERYRATFSQAPIGIVHTGRDGRMLRCNVRFAEFLGYSIEEVVGMNLSQVTLASDIDRSSGLLKKIWEGEAESGTLEKQYLRKDGSSVWGRVSFSTQHDTHGNAIHTISVIENIQAQKVAEELVAKAEQKFRQIFEDAPEGIFQTTPEGKSLALNQAGANLLGFASSEEAVGKIRNSAQDVW